ncbi:MAG: type VI secretion system contractile sheath small subunit [Pikeienuella sp.]|uniref:type VI secretion system contractile sheath small subunit n=1 Tax=Pikeienuella sp. TaxID=2831957 RepID=UPI00391BEC52
MAESIQHKISRVRPPRVQITYDVEIGDAIQKKELPFVIGVIADLSKQRGVTEPDEAAIAAEAEAQLEELMKDPKPFANLPYSSAKLRAKMQDLRADKMEPEELEKAKATAKDLIVEALRRRAGKLDPLAKRDFVEIDRDNFNKVLAEAAPRVKFDVDNVMEPPGSDGKAVNKIAVDLTFSDFEEFSPIKLIDKIPELKKILEARNRLRDFLLKLDGNSTLDETLKKTVGDEAKLKMVIAEIEAKTPAAAPADATAKGKK